MKPYNLLELKVMSTDGFIMTKEQEINNLPPLCFEEWVNICYGLSTDPITWGSAEHMLYIGEKKGKGIR